MASNIVALNAGSSSLKFRVLRMDRPRPLNGPEEILAHGKVERIGLSTAQMSYAIGAHPPTTVGVGSESIGAAVEKVFELLGSTDIDAVGHRIVHGGPNFAHSIAIDASVLEGIRKVTPLAPLHNPGGIAGIEAAHRLRPEARNVAVFDTAFHHRMPAVAATYALPRDLSAKLQIRRYGFHGISYSYVSGRLRLLVGAASTRHIICHLGNGASVCAIRDGASVDTSMGFTPLEGLIMGTRSGDLDPGLLLHLHQVQGWTAEEIDDLLNHHSGLLGLSGATADVEALEAAPDAAAKFALECFAYRVRKYVGAYAAVLGGVDALAFTGGIGQFSSRIRTMISGQLGFLNLAIDDAANARASGTEVERIGERVWVVPTDEERQIARETFDVIGASP